MKIWTKGIVSGLLAGVVILGSLPALAGPPASYYDQRQMDQQSRINQGVQSGRITPGEYRRLQYEQERIRQTEAMMRGKNGRLTPGQKAQLAQMQDQANRDIYRYKHNNNYRPVNCRPGWR
jgi:DNA-binding transcriptional regulator of glucitol operon